VKDVQYFVPRTMEEALQILGERGSKVRILAGGTDLVRDMNLAFLRPEGILWIGKLDLEYIQEAAGWIRIGAATRMLTAGSSALLKEKAAALAYAAGKLASPPVRSLATLGGNLCNASPGADAGCALLGLGAQVVLTSATGQRIVPLEAFYMGPKRTVLQPGELLTEIRVRPTGDGEGSAYSKIGRRQAMTLAVVNATARVQLDRHGCVTSAIIVVGAAAPTLLRIRSAEALLTGQELTPQAVRAAAEIACREIRPIDDVHGTAWYRRKVARVLVERTLCRAGNLDLDGEG
jgi:CO/xanthine dehydrogenase FAD-binding subunit